MIATRVNSHADTVRSADARRDGFGQRRLARPIAGMAQRFIDEGTLRRTAAVV